MRQTVRTVLVVDDDEAVRDSLQALLESYSIRVRSFVSAEDFLGNGVTDAQRCIILDLHMPGMGGVALLEELRKRSPKLPIIVITGRADAALKTRVERAGAVAMLEKPVDDAELMRTLESIFASGG